MLADGRGGVLWKARSHLQNGHAVLRIGSDWSVLLSLTTLKSTRSLQVSLNVGFRISCASLRAETVRAPLLDALADSEQGTITIAPEVATEELQKVVNKAIPREQLYHVFEEALKRDILNLRLYFLIGVPHETPADVEAIVDMAKEMRTILLPHAKRTGRIARISFTISPMVPKPHTPFQWVAMEPP